MQPAPPHASLAVAAAAAAAEAAAIYQMLQTVNVRHICETQAQTKRAHAAVVSKGVGSSSPVNAQLTHSNAPRFCDGYHCGLGFKRGFAATRHTVPSRKLPIVGSHLTVWPARQARERAGSWLPDEVNPQENDNHVDDDRVAHDCTSAIGSLLQSTARWKHLCCKWVLGGYEHVSLRSTRAVQVAHAG